MSEKQELSEREEAKPAPATAVRPPVDVAEDESGITLSADVPGLAKDRLQVRVDGDTLMVEACGRRIVRPGLSDKRITRVRFFA